MNGREKRDNSPWGVADFVWSIQKYKKYKDPKIQKLRSKNQKNTKTKIKEWKGKER